MDYNSTTDYLAYLLVRLEGSWDAKAWERSDLISVIDDILGFDSKKYDILKSLK